MAQLRCSRLLAWGLLGLGQAIRLSSQGTAGAPPGAAESLGEAQLQKLMQSFRMGLARLLQVSDFDRQRPVVATVLDSVHADLAKPWAARLGRLGLRQQVLVVVDSRAAGAAASAGLPALSFLGEALVPSEKRQKKGKSSMESDLTTARLAVPMLLLESGFQRVIFSSMDNFLRSDPLSLLERSVPWSWDACSGRGEVRADAGPEGLPDYVAPPALGGAEGVCLNPALVQYRGPRAAAALSGFLRAWWSNPGRDVRSCHDVSDFEAFLRQKKTDLAVGVLPAGSAEASLERMGWDTAVALLATPPWEPGGLRFSVLQGLYRNESASARELAAAYGEQAARDARAFQDLAGARMCAPGAGGQR